MAHVFISISYFTIPIIISLNRFNSISKFYHESHSNYLEDGLLDNSIHYYSFIGNIQLATPILNHFWIGDIV